MGTVIGTEAADTLNGTPADDTIYGLGSNDTIDAGDGNDTIDGGSGNDTMTGGAGDDIYYVDALADVVIEADGGGYDIVHATTTVFLSDYVDELRLLGTGNYSGTGNGQNNLIVGNDASNYLKGGGGNDHLQGFGGNDTLDGETGDDILDGGAGNDTYIIDSVNDQIVEPSGQGTDLVWSRVSWTLAPGLSIEQLDAIGTNPINLTGNEIGQTINGNGQANVLIGGGGDDKLYGGDGDDTLVGGTGVDTLNGGTGADTMTGGGGDDTYYVDNVGDVVIGGGGYDQIVSYITYILPDNVERLIMGGTRNMTGTGNALDNVLDGNGANNRLYGLGGNDVLRGYTGDDVLDGGTGADNMDGGEGDDTYYVDNVGDVVSDSIGFDLVLSSVSFTLAEGLNWLTLTGNTGLTARGNSGINILTGGDGDDVLIGAGEADTLNGSAGNDTASYEFDIGAVNVSLTTRTGTTGAAKGDVLQSIENLRGTSNYGDTLTGDTGANRLEGLGGDDSLFGGDGDDVLVGGAGADTLDGGAGIDIISYEDAGGSIAANLATGTITGTGADGDNFANIEGVRGTAFDDVFTGTAQTNRFEGGAGNDVFNGGGGVDLVYGGGGIDRASFASLFQPNGVTFSAGSAHGNFGIYESVEYLTFKDGALISDADSVGAQIIRLYDAVLQRAPDAQGMDFYLDRIEDAGGSLLGVANELIGSAEFQAATGTLSNAQFVDYVYAHALGRPADADGRAYYLQQLDAGMSRGSLMLSFSESGEHRAITADLVSQGYFNTDDIYQSVALLYDGAFDRLADADGLTFYAERVKSGAMTLAQVAADFAASGEFSAAIAGKSNGEIVDLIYANALDRAADPAGRAFYVNQLDHGASAASLLSDISLSAEHYNLFAGYITYGIDVI